MCMLQNYEEASGTFSTRFSDKAEICGFTTTYERVCGIENKLAALGGAAAKEMIGLPLKINSDGRLVSKK